MPLKIIETRTNSPSEFTLALWAARRRSGISSFLLHIFACFALAAATFFFGNNGGLVFVGGACITLGVIGLLVRRMIGAMTELFQVVTLRLNL